MKIHERVSLLLFGVALTAGVTAQESAPSVPREGIYVPAEPLKRSAPEYPSRALSAGREGWVRVSFIIAEDGGVIEPMIEDSSHPDFDQSALRAIENWRYKPATVGGKPTEQSMVETMIRYRIEGATGATSQYIKKYRAVYDLIVAKNLTEAAPRLQALEEGKLNFYEQAWLWWLKYTYLEAAGSADPAAQEMALRRALGSSETADDDYLQPDVYVSASQRLFVLRARSGDLSGAVTVFERLKASKVARRSKYYEEVVAALEPVQREIMGLVEGPDVLRQAARIDEHDYWVHRLLRRSFAIGDVQGGNLDVVDVRCKLANRRFVSLPKDAVLKIPASWGDCGVYIKGDIGTTFAFEEFPESAANAVDSAQVAPATTP